MKQIWSIILYIGDFIIHIFEFGNQNLDYLSSSMVKLSLDGSLLSVREEQLCFWRCDQAHMIQACSSLGSSKALLTNEIWVRTWQLAVKLISRSIPGIGNISTVGYNLWHVLNMVAVTKQWNNNSVLQVKQYFIKVPECMSSVEKITSSYMRHTLVTSADI